MPGFANLHEGAETKIAGALRRYPELAGGCGRIVSVELGELQLSARFPSVRARSRGDRLGTPDRSARSPRSRDLDYFIRNRRRESTLDEFTYLLVLSGDHLGFQSEGGLVEFSVGKSRCQFPAYLLKICS